MKAIVIGRFGGPEVLEIREMPEPGPGTGRELVQVEAGGLNFADVMTARGGYPGTPKPPLIAGREFCGKRARGGQRVMGYAKWAAFAQHISARPELLWPVPNGWSAEDGAAFPVNYFTAYFAYWKAGLLSRADSIAPRVLIHAVAGGVGTAAVQIGTLLGAEMYGTSSSDEKLARVKELGLQHGINYKRQDYEGRLKISPMAKAWTLSLRCWEASTPTRAFVACEISGASSCTAARPARNPNLTRGCSTPKAPAFTDCG